MIGMTARLARLEAASAAAEPAGVTLDEYFAASERSCSRVLMRLHALSATEPHWQTVAALEGDSPARAALDDALLRRWHAQQAAPRDADALAELGARLDRLAARRRTL